MIHGMNMIIMNNQLITSQWRKLGVLFNVESVEETPDLEQLIIDTCIFAPKNVRLFENAANWVALYGDYVDQKVLLKLAKSLQSEHRVVLGFLLEWVEQNSSFRFESVVKLCGEAITVAKPLSELERDNIELLKLSESRATDLSKKWGRYYSHFDKTDKHLQSREQILKNNHLLPLNKIMQENENLLRKLAE